MWTGHRFFQRPNRCAWYAKLVQRSDYTVTIRKRCEPILDHLLEGIIVSHPAAIGLELWVLSQFRPPDRVGDPRELMLLYQQHDVTARALEHARWTPVWMLRTIALNRELLLANRNHRHRHLMHVKIGVHQRHIEVLPFAGAGSVEQSKSHRHRRCDTS